MKTSTLVAYCRACQARIRFDQRPELYDIVTCPECDEAFEVISLSPVRLDWPFDYADDDEWSDDFDEDHPFED
ncbi:MAG: lysine biosynthesis protein LysW [Chloroflexota bacterium]|jgi:lysine biosynthesis protein LysW